MYSLLFAKLRVQYTAPFEMLFVLLYVFFVAPRITLYSHLLQKKHLCANDAFVCCSNKVMLQVKNDVNYL